MVSVRAECTDVGKRCNTTKCSKQCWNENKSTSDQVTGSAWQRQHKRLCKNKVTPENRKLPKGTKEMKDLLAYKTTDRRYKNVLMILHALGLIPVGIFKSKIFIWLKMNNV
eukprot:2989151-Ditylum_brightwellii.AAC.1